MRDRGITLLRRVVLDRRNIPRCNSPVEPVFLRTRVLSTLSALSTRVFRFRDTATGIRPNGFASER